MKIVLRLIALPFVIVIMIIALSAQLLRSINNFINYGGEFIAYPEKITTIAKVFNEVRKLVPEDEIKKKCTCPDRRPLPCIDKDLTCKDCDYYK